MRGGVVGVVGCAVATATMEDFAFPRALLPPSAAPITLVAEEEEGGDNGIQGVGGGRRVSW